jgi:hypothetical protein
MSTDLAPRTADDICKAINACSAKLAQAEKKVEDWKDTRRQYLQELKDTFPDIWLRDAKEKCHIGRAMAYRILQLPRSENVGTSTDESLQSRQEESTSAAQAESRASDLPDDAAPDEQAAHWADEMFLRIEQDIKDQAIDQWLGLHALSRLIHEQIVELGKEREATGETLAPPRNKTGRPKGAKNKPKEPSGEPAPQSSGNDVDTEASAEKRKADAAAAEGVAPDEGGIPAYLRRAPEAGAAL